jgi:hypothetical protein
MAGEVLIRLTLDDSELKLKEWLVLASGVVAGGATAALAAEVQQIHNRVQEAWGGTSDAFALEDLVASVRALHVVLKASSVALGFVLFGVAVVF